MVSLTDSCVTFKFNEVTLQATKQTSHHKTPAVLMIFWPFLCLVSSIYFVTLSSGQMMGLFFAHAFSQTLWGVSQPHHTQSHLIGWLVCCERGFSSFANSMPQFLLDFFIGVFLNRVKVEPGFVPLLQVEGNFFNTGDLWKINQKQIFCENCVVMTNTHLYEAVSGEVRLCCVSVAGA